MKDPALLDANVLWSASVRDTLLWTAAEHLYRPRWTLQILDEVRRTLLLKRPDLDPQRIERTIQQMIAYFPGATVEGYQGLIPSMRNHPNDRHVLAAAVYAKAPILVTWNLIDFPPSACSPYGVTAKTPDDYLCDMWAAVPTGVIRALERQSAGLRRPPQTPRQILENLRRTVPRFADAVLLSGMIE